MLHSPRLTQLALSIALAVGALHRSGQCGGLDRAAHGAGPRWPGA